MIAHEGEAWFRKPGFFYLRAFFYGGLGHPGDIPGGSLVRIHNRPRRRSLVYEAGLFCFYNKLPIMHYYGYILYSQALDKYYIGSCEDLDERLRRHLSHHKGYSGKAKDWQVVFQKGFPDNSEALLWERETKRKKSRLYLEWLINQNKVLRIPA